MQLEEITFFDRLSGVEQDRMYALGESQIDTLSVLQLLLQLWQTNHKSPDPWLKRQHFASPYRQLDNQRSTGHGAALLC